MTSSSSQSSRNNTSHYKNMIRLIHKCGYAFTFYLVIKFTNMMIRLLCQDNADKIIEYCTKFCLMTVINTSIILVSFALLFSQENLMEIFIKSALEYVVIFTAIVIID